MKALMALIGLAVAVARAQDTNALFDPDEEIRRRLAATNSVLDAKARVFTNEFAITNKMLAAAPYGPIPPFTNWYTEKLVTNAFVTAIYPLGLDFKVYYGEKGNIDYPAIPKMVAHHFGYDSNLAMYLIDRRVAEALGKLIEVKPTPAPIATAAESKTHGVPEKIYKEIRAEAEREWPKDYFMQEQEIKRQVESYKRLHP